MNVEKVVRPGDIVRFEHEANGIWFYCKVEDARSEGEIVCTVVDAQSWPDLALEGILPGRTYMMHADDVLSVVRPATH
jgi:hypothetical protein